MIPPSRVVLRWSAYEHDHIERHADWYWALAIATNSIALISIVLHDILFAILIILAALTIGMLANIQPLLVNFEISDRGIRIGGALHRYDEVISFWVEEEHHTGRPLLLIDTYKFMAPNIIIPLEHIDPHIVRSYLLQHADEVPMREPIGHKILEFLGV